MHGRKLVGRRPTSDYAHIQEKVVPNQLPFMIVIGSVKKVKVCVHVE